MSSKKSSSSTAAAKKPSSSSSGAKRSSSSSSRPSSSSGKDKDRERKSSRGDNTSSGSRRSSRSRERESGTKRSSSGTKTSSSGTKSSSSGTRSADKPSASRSAPAPTPTAGTRAIPAPAATPTPTAARSSATPTSGTKAVGAAAPSSTPTPNRSVPITPSAAGPRPTSGNTNNTRAAAPQQAPNNMSGYGSMGPGQMGGAGSMGPGAMGGYGSMGGGGPMGGAADASGMGGYGSMYGAGADPSGANPNGSMYGGGAPAGYGSMGGDQFGSMYGGGGAGAGYPGSMMGGMNSMYANPMMGGMGSMYGANPMMGGSMYGANPMIGGMGSMYGANPMMGGSMYGANPMMGGMGSMYGNPMMMNSMYGGGGMGSGMGSGMGGGMGSGYGSLYGASFGMGSMYGSRASSMNDTGIGGMFAPVSTHAIRRRGSDEQSFFAKVLEEASKEKDKKARNVVTTTKAAQEADSKDGKAADADKKAASPAAADKKDAADDKDAASGKDAAGGKEAATAARGLAAPGDKTKDGTAAAPATAAGEKPKDGAAPGDKAKADDAKTRGIVDPKAKEGPDGEDKGIYSLVLVEDGADITANTATRKIGIKDAAGKEATYDANEIIPAAQMTTIDRSNILMELNEHACLGHHITAIVYRKPGVAASTKAASMLAESVMKELSKDSAVGKWKVACRAALMPTPTKCKDLQDPAATVKDADFGSNPVCGPGLREIKSVAFPKEQQAQAVAHIDKLLATPMTPSDLLYIHLIFMQMRGTSAYVSSMLIFVTENPEHLEAMTIGDDRKVPVSLLRTSIGGPGRTVVIAPAKGDKASADSDTAAVRAMATLSSKANRSPRSGNTARFIEFTDAQITKLQGGAAKMDSAQKARQEEMITKLRGMVDDTKKLQTNFDKDEPLIYQPLTSGEAKKASGAAADQSDVPVATPALNKGRELKIAASAANPAAAAAAAAATPAPTKAEEAPKDAPVGKAAAFSSIHRIAIVTDSAAPSVTRSVEVTVDGAKKGYEQNECVLRAPTGAVPESAELARVTNILHGGCNVAILGTDCTGTAPPTQLTWEYVKSVLTGVLGRNDDKNTYTFQMYMAVVTEDRLVADLQASTRTPASQVPLVVASSPLVGAVVHETLFTKLTKSNEVNPALDYCLKAAVPALAEPGSFIYAMFVMKHVRKDGGVSIASLCAASMDNAKVYAAASDRACEKPVRQLLSYPLGGPCSTAMLVVLCESASKNTNVGDALSVQRSMAHVRSASPRVGDLKEFIGYVTTTIAANKAKLASTADSADKLRTTGMIEVWSARLTDHSSLLAKPAETDVPFYVEAKKDKAEPTPPQTAATLPSAAAAHQADAPADNAKPVERRGRREEPAAAPEKAVSPAKLVVVATAKPMAASEAVKPDRHRELSPSDVKKAESPAKSAAAAAASPPEQPEQISIRTVAVITEAGGSAPALDGWNVSHDGNTVVVTDVEGIHQYEADEVLTREKRLDPMESSVLDDLGDKFLEGHPVSILCCDARGSAVCLETADNAVRRVMSKMGPDAELYMTLTAYREKEGLTCDTLATAPGSEPTTSPLHVSITPLIGPYFKHQTFKRIESVQDFEKAIRSGLLVCQQLRASGVLHLFLCNRKPEEKDVVVSTMLMTLCPAGVQLYRLTLDQQPRQRGILNAAVGGMCNTAYVFGLAKLPAGDDSLAVCKVSNAMRDIKNFATRPGSARIAKAKSERAAEQAKAQEASTTNEEKRKKIEQYHAKMVGLNKVLDAYLEDPVNKPPPCDHAESNKA